MWRCRWIAGATANFISRELARRLNLEIKDTMKFEVKVGMGARVKNMGRAYRCRHSYIEMFLFRGIRKVRCGYRRGVVIKFRGGEG